MEAVKLLYQGYSPLNSSKKHCSEHKLSKHGTHLSRHSLRLYQQRRNSASFLAIRATNSHMTIKETNGSAKEKEHPLYKGLGIVDFLKDKNILVTGATGFLAKVVIEKILRTQPQVGKLFLIIKAKDSEAALERMESEIIRSELFRHLRAIYGGQYEKFVLTKLVPVAGDVSLDNLRIQVDVADKLARQVDIILNSAAVTSFDARMVDPIIAYYAKGQLTALIGDPNVTFDIVPADMVANAILAVMAKHAGKSGLEIYQMASSLANPIFMGELFGMFYQYFKAHPYVDVRGKPIKVKDSLKLFGNMEVLSSHDLLIDH